MDYNRNIINKYHKKLILFGMLFFIFFIGITSAFANVKVEGDRISVDAKGIALGELVKEIKNSTGIEFQLSKTLLEKKISVGFKELSLTEGLKKIIDPLNYAVVYDPGGMISKVIIIDTNEDSKMTAYDVKVDESFPDNQDVSTSKVEPDNDLFNDVSSAENASGSDNNKISAKPPFPEISLPEKAHGEQAIQALAGKLPEVAAWYGTTPQQFTTMLRQDLTAWIDTKGRLFFIEEFPEEAAMDESSTPAAAPFPYDQTFKLHSRPGSKRVLFLDFDGHTTTGTWWNSSYGDPIISPAYSMDGDRTSFSNSEMDRIQKAWQLVAEDYAPFDVDVTTEDPGQDAITRSSSSDDRYGTRVVMTVDDFAGCLCGGFAYVGTFDSVGDSGKPAFVFNTSEKGMSEAVSHEVGHNLGLYHDGVTGGATYYSGHGSGATGWAPIMGVGYYKELVQWSKGEYSNANQTEDDIQIIQNNGALLMADDHGNDQTNASALNETTDGVTVTLNGNGFIERRTDIDFFNFTSGSGDISITIDPAPFSPNLDILAELYDSNDFLIATSNPVDGLSASINETALPAGEYFISIDGIGKGDPLGTGYTDYASLGQYSISGSVPDPGTFVPVTWADTVGVTVNGNSITKNASNGWGNSGAASLENFIGDGGVEFSATQIVTNRMCGLSSTNSDADYASIEYAIYLRANGELKVYENGVSQGYLGSYQIGDSLSVERVSSTIVYKKNDVIFYTSVTPTNSTLFVDGSIYNNAGEISDVKLIGIAGLPATITDLTAADGNNEVVLNWTAPTNNLSPITEYEVQYGTVYSGNFDTIFTDDVIPGATITGLINGVEYQFRVVAINAIGTGPASNIVKSTPYKETVVTITWADMVGVTVNGNSITKNASNGWGNGGAASLESFTGDGGVEFVATQANTYRMCGLSSTNTDADYASIEYAIYLRVNGELQVYENGVSQGYSGSYQIGDSLSVERVDSTIVYKKNNVIFYTSVTAAGSALFVDYAIYNNGGEISDVKLIEISGTGVVPFTWVDTVGVTVNGNAITKNATNGWGNSGAASLESFTGDGGVEFSATQTVTNRMCGLSSTNTDADYASIEYAIYLRANGVLQVYENGVSQGYSGTYQIGDRFMVERVGSTIVYKKNDVIFYTSVTPTNSALFVDYAIYNNGGEISDVKLIGIAGPPGTVTDLTAADGNNEVALNWTAPDTNLSPITGYEVQYGTVSGGTFDTIFTDDATPGATITGLTNGVECQFRVVAKNTLGTGPASNVDKATPRNYVTFTWVDTVGVIVNGNSITKNVSTGWGNSGAASLENFAGDGSVEFVANQTDTYRMCGLSSTNTDADYASIEYAIYLRANGELQVYENGVSQGYSGSYQIGDRFMVERVGSTIFYKKNDVIFYTSVTPANSALLVDCTIYNNGGEISDVKLIGIAGPPGAITDLTAVDGNNEVTLNWTAPANNLSLITEYEVQYGTLSGGTFDTIFTDDATPGATITGLDNDVKYQFRVVAKNAIGTGPVSIVVNSTKGNVVIITWVDTVGVTVNGNSIIKNVSNGWGNGGAASLESFMGDGGVEFVPTQTNTYRMCGLSSTNTDADYASIEYAIFLSANGGLKVYENGIYKGYFGSYQIGDSLSVERVGSTIFYKKNEVIFYTSLTPMDSALLVDCTIYNNGGEISDVKLIEIDGPPGAITDLTAADGNNEVVLNWTAPANNHSPITEYEVQYGTVSSGIFDTIFTDDATPGATITGLTNGVEYQFRVVAKNALGTGSASNVDKAIPRNYVPFTWADTVGVTSNGNSITKNASNGWGNGGAASLESITGDGGVEFVATETDTYRMCGLSSTNTDADYASIEYAILLRPGGVLQVYENGIYKGYSGSYQIGDGFMVERVGSIIFYKKNDVIFHTSLTPAGSVLLVDCCIYNNGGEISDVKLIDMAGMGGSASDTTPPSTPDNLQATAISASQIDLSWDASTDDVGVTGYSIYRDGTQIDTTGSSTYQDTGLSASTSYMYTVSAIDGAENESYQSLSASATTGF